MPGFRAGVLAFGAGWLTTELAPHLLALTAADAAAHATGAAPRPASASRSARRSIVGLACSCDQARRVRAGRRGRAGRGPRRRLRRAARRRADPGRPGHCRGARWSTRSGRARRGRAGAPRHRLRARARPARPARRLHARRAARARSAGAAAGARRRRGSLGKKDQQGIPLMQHLAAKGWVCVAINYRLSPRDRLAGAHRRREAGDRLDPRAHRGVRRRPDYIAITGGSAGGHLAALAALTPNDPDFQPGFEDADTSVQVAVPHYGVYDMAGSERAAPRRADARPVPRARGCCRRPGARTRRRSRPPPRCCGSRPARPTSSCCTACTTPWSPSSRPALFVARLRETSKRTVVYAELPGAQHAFDVFPSIRSRARGPRHRPLPALALEHLAPGPAAHGGDHRVGLSRPPGRCPLVERARARSSSPARAHERR